MQGLADSSAAVSFGAIEEAVGQSLAESDGEDFGVDLDAEDESKAAPVVGAGEDDGIDFRFVDSEDDFLEAFRGGKGRKAAVDHDALDREKLEGVLRDLIACRQMLDRVMKDG